MRASHLRWGTFRSWQDLHVVYVENDNQAGPTPPLPHVVRERDIEAALADSLRQADAVDSSSDPDERRREYQRTYQREYGRKRRAAGQR